MPLHIQEANMITPKLLTVIFSQDAAGVRTSGSRTRIGQGRDIKRSARVLRSDTGQEVKRINKKIVNL